jgi:hypothetical protein
MSSCQQIRLEMICLLFSLLGGFASAQEGPAIDLKDYRADGAVKIEQGGGILRAEWPLSGNKGDHGELVLHLKPDLPLIHSLGIAKAKSEKAILLFNANPVTWLTVGSRDLSKQGWSAFFDNPPRRPHQTHAAQLSRKSLRVSSAGERATIAIGELTAGSFKGELQITLYANTPLVHVTAVLSTDEDARAILYDAGISSATPSWKIVAWLDTKDELQRASMNSNRNAAAVAVRHRTIVAEDDDGSVAFFPPPHQFLYPLDFSDNFKLAWQGTGYRQSGEERGLGVRQPPEGDGRFVPWVNAPPGTKQRLSVFYLLSRGDTSQAIEEVKKFTNGDRFRDLAGYKKFTSHFHVEHTLDYLAKQRQQQSTGIPKGLEEPGFVRAFKSRGVDIVHLAEFHVGHSPDFIAQRLVQLELMHRECERLSNDQFLLLPGEEPNVHLGGHWISFFPKPVYWHLHPKPGDPFVREVEGLGKVYAVRNADEIKQLMEAEGGLMWTAHPRTKSSFGFPDKYRSEPFYLSDRYLGAAWKAMPADLSLPRLGTRSLDLLSDMANWGQQKYVLGEVDVFKVEPDHELYGHMNINYLKLDKLPKFDEGWQPVVDCLRNGKFFVTTGEVLISRFTVNEKESGETVELADSGETVIKASLDWTFPPNFVEIIWGDGEKVHRQRFEETAPNRPHVQQFLQTLKIPGAKWIRLEAWDIAANGAFTQPVWIK